VIPHHGFGTLKSILTGSHANAKRTTSEQADKSLAGGIVASDQGNDSLAVRTGQHGNLLRHASTWLIELGDWARLSLLVWPDRVIAARQKAMCLRTRGKLRPPKGRHCSTGFGPRWSKKT